MGNAGICPRCGGKQTIWTGEKRIPWSGLPGTGDEVPVSAQRAPWRVVRQTIDSTIHDRESAYPPVDLEMVPLGTTLPRDQQRIELHISVDGGREAILDSDGIAALREFLDIVP
jgi:hypothetical protein